MSKLNEIDPYQQFLRDLFHSDDDGLSRLQEEAESEGIPNMSIGPEQGKFLQLLVQLTGARKVLEIGVLGGYSGTWIARALPEDGKLIGLELEQKHADFARKQWQRMGLASKIEVRVGPALKSLPHLTEEAPFDLIFIDADKGNYPAYLDYALQYSRPGTVILGDNVEMWGSLVDPEKQDWDWVQGMRSFARALSSHERLTSTVVPYPDGLAMAVVK
ncbi:MAG: O-methyltransferase [Caldilineaceae bacterium SB0661_bin_32]|uniref:O-methyltransferase n=1 Tax=Caldilineaceae bacterium SB0661_bin_32 TaxID=2605255 RepID=A0A6B1D660_9CHLR|nr:O-methyltransferase [Caldilineaceae bacterium SB0661_bin_32]